MSYADCMREDRERERITSMNCWEKRFHNFCFKPIDYSLMHDSSWFACHAAPAYAKVLNVEIVSQSLVRDEPS
jgi:hypothetical protein